MPALQVRDFPQGLYQELKDYSALNYRSIAQQTIYAVEQMIHGADNNSTALESKQTPARLRAQKREDILARAAQRKALRSKTPPSPVAALSEARSEREAYFNSFDDSFLRNKQ